MPLTHERTKYVNFCVVQSIRTLLWNPICKCKHYKYHNWTICWWWVYSFWQRFLNLRTPGDPFLLTFGTPPSSLNTLPYHLQHVQIFKDPLTDLMYFHYLSTCNRNKLFPLGTIDPKTCGPHKTHQQVTSGPEVGNPCFWVIHESAQKNKLKFPDT